MSDTAGGPLLYSLYAIVVHSGDTCLEGHFLCYTKVKSSFHPDMEKCVLGNTNFASSVTGSQSFGGEVLLWDWTGFVSVYSCFGSFLPLVLWRNPAVPLTTGCLSLQASNGLWYKRDDETVENCDIHTVLGQQAYLLFYAR